MINSSISTNTLINKENNSYRTKANQKSISFEGKLKPINPYNIVEPSSLKVFCQKLPENTIKLLKKAGNNTISIIKNTKDFLYDNILEPLWDRKTGIAISALAGATAFGSIKLADYCMLDRSAMQKRIVRIDNASQENTVPLLLQEIESIEIHDKNDIIKINNIEIDDMNHIQATGKMNGEKFVLDVANPKDNNGESQFGAKVYFLNKKGEYKKITYNVNKEPEKVNNFIISVNGEEMSTTLNENKVVMQNGDGTKRIIGYLKDKIFDGKSCSFLRLLIPAVLYVMSVVLGIITIVNGVKTIQKQDYLRDWPWED